MRRLEQGAEGGAGPGGGLAAGGRAVSTHDSRVRALIDSLHYTRNVEILSA